VLTPFWPLFDHIWVTFDTTQNLMPDSRPYWAGWWFPIFGPLKKWSKKWCFDPFLTTFMDPFLDQTLYSCCIKWSKTWLQKWWFGPPILAKTPIRTVLFIRKVVICPLFGPLLDHFRKKPVFYSIETHIIILSEYSLMIQLWLNNWLKPTKTGSQKVVQKWWFYHFLATFWVKNGNPFG